MDCWLLGAVIVVIGIEMSYTMELVRLQQRCNDASVDICQNQLHPHHCYSDHNKAICCQTCERKKDKTNKVCQWGDHNVLIRKKGQRYTCESYIRTFGKGRCRDSFEFRSQCCKSCDWRGL